MCRCDLFNGLGRREIEMCGQLTNERTDLVADGLLTVHEAERFLRLSRSSLYILMERGELAFVKLGRSRRIPRRAVVALAARGLKGGVRVTEVI